MDIFKNINNQMDLQDDISRNVPVNQNNIYQNGIASQASRAERDIVSKNFNNSRNAIQTGVIPKNFNQNIVNTTNKFNNYQQYQDFKDQFSEEDKFVISPLTGQKMLKEDFGHQNMTPFFGSNIKQNNTDHSNATALEHQTGSIKNFRNKQEIPYMFDPQQRVNQVNGTPVYDEELTKRFIASGKKQQELPIKQIRVGPGLNQGYSEKPCGGLNQANKRDFIMPKNVDELRVMNNPKKQYKGRIVAGIKSGQRGMQAKVNKNLPDKYFNNSPDRYFTSVVTPKNKIRERVRVKKTNRQCSTSYTGTAGPTINNRPEKRGLYRKTRRNCYVNAGVRNADGAGKWNAADDDENYGKNSFNLPLNERDTTQQEAPLMNLTTGIKSIVTPIQDFIKTSKKENFVGNERPYGNFSGQLPNKMTVYDPNDVARTTIKETNIHDTRDGQVSGPIKLTVYDPNDVAKTTIKETNIHDTRDGNISNAAFKGRVYDPNDIAKTTIKETNIHDTRDGNISNAAFKGTVYDPNDITRTTIKETNIHDTRAGGMSTNRPNGQIYNQDDAKVTVRNTLEEVDKTINLSSIQKKSTVYDPNDIPEATTKDTNIHNERTGNVGITGVNKGTGYQTAGIQAPNTNKQFTSDHEYQGVADGDVGKGGGEGYLVTNYEAKNVSRQFIADNEYMGTADSNNDKPMSYDDAYNASLNYNKEKIAVGRAPTKTGVKLNVGESDINIDIRKLESDILNIREMNMNRVTSAIPGKIEQGATSNRVPLPEDRNLDRLNPEMVEQFKENPFTQSLSSY